MRGYKFDRKYLVYMHISPNNKRYVGITSQSTTHRWGEGGKRYQRNSHFWSAINKYGWDNFEHIIIASELNYEDACKMEQTLITEYDSTNPKFGYNHTYGGEMNIPSDDVREKLRISTSSRWKQPEFRNKVISKLKGHSTSEETKQKISKANLGRKFTKPAPLKGRHLSEEHKAKLRGKTSRCKGLTKETCPKLAAMGEKSHNRTRTEEERRHISEGQKLKYKNGYAPKWLNNGEVEIIIDSSCEPIPSGFVSGRLVNYKYVYKGNISKRVPFNLVNQFISDGWNLGRDKLPNMKIANQRCIWIYDNQEFSCAKDLAKYLNSNGYPNIVSSTITALYNRGFDKSPTYYNLAGKITRININENTKN